MAAQLAINGNVIELAEDITFNFQTADVGDLKVSKSNYTSSFKIPRTVEVQLLFDGLGIASDRSQYPYNLGRADCMDNYNILYSGNLVIIKSDRLYYHATVISGVADFFQIISDTLFSALDLSDVYYPKTPADVMSSVRSGTDRNGMFMLGVYARNPYFNEGLNVDVFAYSVKVQYLLNKAFDFAQMTYSIPSNIVLNNEFVTFPYPPYPEVSSPAGSQSSEFIKNQTSFPVSSFVMPVDVDSYRSNYNNFNSVTIREADFNMNGLGMICNNTANYTFNFAECVAWVERNGNRSPINVSIRVNGSEVASFDSQTVNSPGVAAFTFSAALAAGDHIDFHFEYLIQYLSGTNATVYIGAIVLYAQKSEFTPNGIERIFGLSIADFIKEFMWRYALIPFQTGNHIDFVPLADLVDRSRAIDWSDKYNERTEESYDVGYGVNNWLKHSYVDSNEAGPYDRLMVSNNKNVEQVKNVVESKFYAPPEKKFPLTFNMQQAQPALPVDLFETYVATQSGIGVNVSTSQNFYFVTRSFNTTGGYSLRLTSSSLGSTTTQTITSFNMALFEAGFKTNPYWNALMNIIINSRLHIIEVDLKNTDVYDLDQTRSYYFEQEQAFYILRAIQYKKGKLSKGSFIKINY